MLKITRLADYSVLILCCFKDKKLSAKSWSGAFRTGRRRGSGVVSSGKAVVLLADNELSAKSWSGAFRTCRRRGSGAVLSGNAIVLFADKGLSVKSWPRSFRTGRRGGFGASQPAWGWGWGPLCRLGALCSGPWFLRSSLL